MEPNDRFVTQALGYVARQARTAHQVTEYLQRKGAPDERIQEILARFRQLGYLDDAAIARRWAEARLAKYPMGAARLKDELQRKGIPAFEIADVVTALYPPNHERVLAERLVAQQALRGALSVRKCAALLGSRGFDADVIESVLARQADAAATAGRSTGDGLE
ncbi:MAG: regulatory protein RecX [Nitrospiraceae bacterium]